MVNQEIWAPQALLGHLALLVRWVCRANMECQALKVSLDKLGLQDYQACVGTKGPVVLWGSQGFLGRGAYLGPKGCLAQWARKGKMVS